MTALVVTDVFHPDTIGGAGRMARHLAQGLADDMRVLVVTRNEDGRLPPHETCGGLEIHRFYVDRSRSKTFFTSAVINSVRLVAHLARKHHFQRLVVHQPLSGLAAIRLLRSVPAVYVFHSPWSEEYRTQVAASESSLRMRQQGAWWARKAVEGALVKRARRVMVLSRYMACLLTQIHGIPAARIAEIPGGVDVHKFQPGLQTGARATLGLPPDAEIILTVRNLMPRMGLDTLIEAFGPLAAKRPRAQLVIAGGGPLQLRLERQVTELGLDGRVHLLGRVSDGCLPDLYRSADAFVMATRALEGFGIATIEALASGVPAVATPVGASPEILNQLDPSLLAHSSSAEDIADALDAFLSRPQSDRAELAKRARELCVELYGWPTVCQAFNELVRSVG